MCGHSRSATTACPGASNTSAFTSPPLDVCQSRRLRSVSPAPAACPRHSVYLAPPRGPDLLDAEIPCRPACTHARTSTHHKDDAPLYERRAGPAALLARV